MVRTQACRDRIDWLMENCPLDRTSLVPIKKATEICEKHVEISTLSTHALQPLCKVKNDVVMERAVQKIRGIVATGKRPTKKQVEQIVRSEELSSGRNEMIHRGVDTQLPQDIVLYHGDFLREYTKIPAGSVDCIITDPPYVKEWIHNFPAFSKAAEYVLKPGGFLVMYIGHIWLDQILSMMTEHLDYYWIMAITHPASRAAIHGRMVQCGHKPILVFNKPPQVKPKRYFNDLIVGGVREKALHEWQQGENELINIFEPFTNAGDTVLDPFMGSGTVISMAKKMGRKAIGFDIVGENVEVVKGRLQDTGGVL